MVTAGNTPQLLRQHSDCSNTQLCFFFFYYTLSQEGNKYSTGFSSTALASQVQPVIWRMLMDTSINCLKANYSSQKNFLWTTSMCALITAPYPTQRTETCKWLKAGKTADMLLKMRDSDCICWTCWWTIRGTSRISPLDPKKGKAVGGVK